MGRKWQERATDHWWDGLGRFGVCIGRPGFSGAELCPNRVLVSTAVFLSFRVCSAVGFGAHNASCIEMFHLVLLLLIL